MAALILSNVLTDQSEEKLHEDLSKYGNLHFLKIQPNPKSNDGTFVAFVQYAKLNDQKSLIKFIYNSNMTYHSKDIPHISKKAAFTEKVIPKNTIPNASFHFYKDSAYGKDIEKYIWEKGSESLFSIDNTNTFELVTTYPGLLTGSGYSHPKLKENKDDFQLGFFFDYTTGLPIVSGSSIKGLIRSVFPQKNKDLYSEKIDFFNEEYGYKVDDTLIEEIFESSNTAFYDAYIIDTENDGKIFGSDYITSHYSDEELGEFKEPNPIKFLKILPGVTFKFQFKAKNEHVDLFKKIILDFGLGAKTNVGYGQFKE